jgi:hypothetical protein
MVSVAWSSTRYSPRGVKKSRSLTSSGQMPVMVMLVVFYVDGIRTVMLTFSDPDHPEELVDVVTGVAEKTAENDKHVVDFVLTHDWPADLLTGAHGLADGGDVGVVPGVVVDKSRTVSHAANLVAESHQLMILAFCSVF